MAKQKEETKTYKKGQFKTGNNFWTKRSKHGRDAIFSDPDTLWEAACEYFEYSTSDPLEAEKAFSTGSVGIEKRMRPFSLEGLCIFLGVNTRYLTQFKANDIYKGDFPTIMDTIEEIIYKQQYDGASCNLLNANIIARKLGLANREDLTTNGESLNGFDDLMKAATNDTL